MTLTPRKVIPIDQIEIRKDRARSLDEAWAEVLAGLIDDVGLKQPIEIRKTDDGYCLIAGLHRIAAFNLLYNQKATSGQPKNGFDKIPAFIIEAKTDQEAAEFKLHEVIENLARRELNVLDRAAHLFEMKRAYEILHPEAKNGQYGGRGSKKNESGILSFSKKAAQSTGFDERSIQRAVKIHKNITPTIRSRIESTWLADHQAGLLGLADVGAKQQKKICDLLFSDPPKAANVKDAITLINAGRLLSHTERKFNSINTALAGLKEDQLDHVFEAHAAQIMGWLKRSGRG